MQFLLFVSLLQFWGSDAVVHTAYAGGGDEGGYTLPGLRRES
jgi:hypothetical protein